MSIPENAEKYSNKMYEEIRIPHTQSPPPHVADIILVKELDHICQVNDNI